MALRLGTWGKRVVGPQKKGAGLRSEGQLDGWLTEALGMNYSCYLGSSYQTAESKGRNDDRRRVQRKGAEMEEGEGGRNQCLSVDMTRQWSGPSVGSGVPVTF